MSEKVAIVIPAYNPTKELIELVNEMSKDENNVIIVVNDGTENAEIFEQIKDKCKVIKHDKNFGQGRF